MWDHHHWRWHLKVVLEWEKFEESWSEDWEFWDGEEGSKGVSSKGRKQTLKYEHVE